MRQRRRLQLSCALALGLFGLGGEARADTIPLTSRLVKTNPNSIGIAVGMDGTWALDLAYARRFRNVFGRRYPLQLEARISQPFTSIIDYGGTRLGGTVSALFYARNGLGVSAGLGPDVAFSYDTIGARFGFGGEAFVRPGFWSGTGTVMLDLGYRLGYATCMIHRQAVDNLYGDRYPGASSGPQDGCIPLAAQRFRAGLILALVSPELAGGSLFVASGVQYTPQIGGVFSHYPLTPLPFYLKIGMNLMFR
jgi:hypothetical protein